MIEAPVLLFPDAGEPFMRSLRAAVLYSDEVRVLTVLDRTLAERICDALAGLDPNTPVLLRRLTGYFRFVLSASSDLEKLTREGVLKPVVTHDEQSWEQIIHSRELAAAKLDVVKRSGVEEAAWQGVMAEVGGAFDTFAPCLADLDMMAFAMRYLEGDRTFDFKTIADQERLLKAVFFRYLVQIAVMSERLGSPTLSWSPQFQRALWAVRALFASINQEQDQQGLDRVFATADLARNVLERYLPSADDLPIEELLSLRLKRRDELNSLRIAVRQLATEVNVNASPQEIQLQVRDLAAKHVDPAIDEVRRAIAASRLDVLKKIGRSSASLAAATFSASIAVAAGAPLDAAAAVAAIGGILGVALEGEVERLHLMRASQWSFLFRLSPKREVVSGNAKKHGA